MTDHANIVREALTSVVPKQPCDSCTHDHCYCTERHDKSLAALAALETELAEARRATAEAWEYERLMLKRAMAAEAELAEANECIRTMLHDKDEDVEAIVARSEAAERERDEAQRLLREVVKADRQDALMGYPIPGDSCMGAFIGLVLMQYLDEHPDPRNRDDNPHPDAEDGT